jgi:hypothetical protein
MVLGNCRSAASSKEALIAKFERARESSLSRTAAALRRSQAPVRVAFAISKRSRPGENPGTPKLIGCTPRGTHGTGERAVPADHCQQGSP